MPICGAGYNVLQLLQWALCKQRTEQLVTNASFLVQEKKSSIKEKKPLNPLAYPDLNMWAEII